MRRAVTFARKGTSYQVLLGPEVPLRTHIEAFKQSVGDGEFGDADEIEIWTSAGRVKRAKSPGHKPHRKPRKPAAPQSPEAPKPSGDKAPEEKTSELPAKSQDTKGMGDVLKNSQPAKKS